MAFEHPDGNISVVPHHIIQPLLVEEDPARYPENMLKFWTDTALYAPRDARDSELFPLPWGPIYPHRIWCSVLTIYPDHVEHMYAI